MPCSNEAALQGDGIETGTRSRTATSAHSAMKVALGSRFNSNARARTTASTMAPPARVICSRLIAGCLPYQSGLLGRSGPSGRLRPSGYSRLSTIDLRFLISSGESLVRLSRAANSLSVEPSYTRLMSSSV